MPTFPAAALRDLAQHILEAAGTPPDIALVVADTLVEANLVGHDSHGVIRLNVYVRFVRQGRVRPDARPSLMSGSQAAARVDGAWGWGQMAATLATQTAIELAREHGVAAVTISHCNHVGRLGRYVETIARAGMAGMACCNADVAVAPYGGRQALLGTNPFAWAVPRGPEQPPLLLDFATSGVAEGKLQVARAKGEQLQPGLILDREGRPSRDPEDFYSGGVLLPFGGHKGYAMSLLIELLGGALSGAAPSALSEYDGSNGTLLLAIDIARLVPMSQFVDQVEALASLLKASPPADGFGEVLLPGEPEAVERRRRSEQGITLPQRTWEEIQALASELSVASVIL